MKYRIFETVFGHCAIVFDEKGIFRFYLPFESQEKLLASVKAEFSHASEDLAVKEKIIILVKSYFKGKKVEFNVKINFRGYSEFEKRVLAEAMKIPYGSTATYEELARRVESPSAARAVGSVMSKNRVPLIIPCHRVISASGKLGGFSAEGGVEFKRKLLNLEKNGLKS